MYVCPQCHEEIPDRVKASKDECPFCHEPWPPEEPEAPPEPEPEPAKPAWGHQAPRPAAAPAAVAEPPKKSKVGLIVAILVLVLGGGGAGLYFGVFAKKKGAAAGGGGKSAAKGGVSDTEWSRVANWYDDAFKVVNDYFQGTCSQYQQSGYKYLSKVKLEKKKVSLGGKEEDVATFLVELVADPAGKPLDKPDPYSCPKELAALHKDHAIVIDLDVWERKSTFGAEMTYADIQVSGKMLSYLKPEKLKFRSTAVLERAGFSFPGFKDIGDEGLAELAKPQSYRIAPDGKTWTLANLTMNRTKKGRFTMGGWRMELRTDDVKAKISDWAVGCDAMRKRLGKLDSKAAEDHVFHQKMWDAALAATKPICEGMEKLSKALDPVNDAEITAALALIQKSRDAWNTTVHAAMTAAAQKGDFEFKKPKF